MARKATFELSKETQPFTSARNNVIELAKLLSDCGSILDVGCGKSSPLRFVSAGRLVGVDAYSVDLEQARAHRTHDEFLLGDVKDLKKHFSPGEFDACVALDVLEHFTEASGRKLLLDLESLAKKKVIIITPNGFLPQVSEREGDFQEHRSGWQTNQMRDLGYEVIGLDGLKVLRAEHQQLRFKPAPIWAVISWLTQTLWCRNHPRTAAALLCWKTLQ